MKAKLMTLLAGILVLGLLLFAGSQQALAEQKDKLTIAVSELGYMTCVPGHEDNHGKDYLKLIFDQLTAPDQKGNFENDNAIAKKWEMTPDGITWTFYLRKGIKFHDGVELTAKDVKFSMEWLMFDKDSNKPGERRYMKESIKSIEVKDPYTLVVHHKKPSIFLPDFMGYTTTGFIVPKEYFEKLGYVKYMKNPIGSGPYKVSSVMDATHLKVDAVKKHWRGKPRYKRVHFLIVPEESTRIAMLRTGEANISGQTSRGKIKEVLGAGLNLVTSPNNTLVTWVCMSQWLTPAFSDIRFRKALNLAIDKESIIKNIFEGRGGLATTFPGKNAMSLLGDLPHMEPYPYNPEEAKRLIKEAGYEGHEIKMPHYIRGGLPESQELVETIAGYWRKVGLKTKVFMTEWSSFKNTWRTRKGIDMVMYFDQLLDPNAFQIMDRQGRYATSPTKQTFVQDPKLDKLFAKARSSLDPAEVKQLVIDAYKYQFDQYTYIPIAVVGMVVATTKDVPKWDLGSLRYERNYIGLVSGQ